MPSVIKEFFGEGARVERWDLSGRGIRRKKSVGIHRTWKSSQSAENTPLFRPVMLQLQVAASLLGLTSKTGTTAETPSIYGSITQTEFT